VPVKRARALSLLLLAVFGWLLAADAWTRLR
jgi:hypothetical protein